MLDFERIIDKDKGKPVRIQAVRYEGKLGLDIRELYQDKETGEWKPGKKGVRFYVGEPAKIDGEGGYDQLNAFLACVAEFAQELEDAEEA